MKNVNVKLKMVFSGLLSLMSMGASQQSFACGGFFCDNVPINQAAEQIVFRQEGSEITAMIKIDYVGEAEDFGWVLPVPNTPEISLGSDLTFTELEFTTRPRFMLERVGEGCFDTSNVQFSEATEVKAGGLIVQKSDVIVEQAFSIGAFDAKVVSSDNALALSNWLAENNFDLSSRGSELLAPYIEKKSKFVVLKLKNNAGIGSIQPVILKYQSDTPVIPMTLTAVAANNDMGVLVWLLGDSRGVPKNFYHVIPNYTRLNWFSGTRSAYASYQSLITEAMNEAGGQGFATDFAGYMPELTKQLTTSESWVKKLELWRDSTDANFIALVWNELDAVVQSEIQLALPTSNTFIYQNPVEIQATFTSAQLESARTIVSTVIQKQVIEPLDTAIDILDDGMYLTRLYTTLSADEMTLNPVFTFNAAMPDQPLVRNATLTANCKNDTTHWLLKLGEGTGREDEIVVDAWEPIPFTAVATQQTASWRVEKTSANADPVVLKENDHQVLPLSTKPKSSGGLSDVTLLSLLSALLICLRFSQIRHEQSRSRNN